MLLFNCVLFGIALCSGTVAINTQASQSFHQSRINKREENRWIWGFAEPDTVTQKLTTTTTAPQLVGKSTYLNGSDPCDPFEPKLPNLFRPGLRISQIKCAEYLWELTKRIEEKRRFDACISYKRSLGINFAIGGRNTVPGEFPHMGAIGWESSTGTWIFKCGSSLISPKFVLTAAHCSRASEIDTSVNDPTPKIVRIGDKNIADDSLTGIETIDANISRIIVHPNYKSPKKYNDIALMELSTAIEFTKMEQLACLWYQDDTTRLGNKATLTGWGVIDAARLKTTPELQAADVDIIDSKLCDSLLRPMCSRNWCGIENTQICAGKLAGGVDSCQGDSGGPLQIRLPLRDKSEGQMHYIIGITSFGFGCALEDTPGVYTRVSSYIDWIESIVWPSV